MISPMQRYKLGSRFLTKQQGAGAQDLFITVSPVSVMETHPDLRPINCRAQVTPQSCNTTG